MLESRNGNLYAALHTSKSLSEVERLGLIVAKQELEIVRFSTRPNRAFESMVFGVYFSLTGAPI